MTKTIQPDLPWNVAGIAPEAREAARTSARREGLSVAEWLTRRILRGLPDVEGTADEWWLAQTARDRTPSNENPVRSGHVPNDDCPRRLPQRADDVHHDLSGHGDARRAAAAGIESAPHNDSEKSDQLEERLVLLDARIARVEIRAAAEEAKHAETVKALQTKMTELTDQLSRTAARGETQSTELARTIGAVAEKFLHAGHEADERRDEMSERISAIAEDTVSLGNKLGEAREDNERQLRGIEDRIAATEIAVEAVKRDDALDRIEGSIEQLSRRLETTEAGYLFNVDRIESRLTRIETNPAEAMIDQRLQGIEQTLADLTKLIEKNAVETPTATDSAAHHETTDREPAVTEPTGAHDDMPYFGAETAMPILDLPPFAEKPGSGTTPYSASAASPAADLRTSDQSSNAYEDTPKRPLSAEVESFLAAARRSAHAGTVQPEKSSFSWVERAVPNQATDTGHTRLFLLGGIGLLALAAIGTGLYLSNSFSGAPAVAAKPVHYAVLATGRKLQAAPTQFPRMQAILHAGPSPDHVAAVATQVSAPGRTVASLDVQATATQPRVLPLASASQTKAVATPPALPTPQQRLAALANAGQAKAQEVLGLAYLDGDGVAVNEAEGAKWLERAATKGEAVAAYRLGTLYERGHGVTSDPAIAVQWYRIAAKAGNRKAMHNLAVAYAQGTGVQKDLSLAAQWFLRAANLGLADSQFNLGVLYERGMGVPQSLADAYKWYAIAAAQGDTESKSRMDAIASQLGASDRAAADKFATRFQPMPFDRVANAPPVAASLVGG